MKRFVFLAGFFLLASCSALPAIRPAADHSRACPSPFPAEKTRFIHAVEAVMAGETKAVMIGITVADPLSQTISSAIVSPEGLSLFEAFFGPDGVNVSRALPPFDAPDFASNMMSDLKLIFFAPRGKPRQKGIGAEGEAVCRWQEMTGGWIDVAQCRDGRVRILRYSGGGRLQRTAVLSLPPGNPYAAVLLDARGWVRYQLVMTLIEAETLRD